MPPRPKKSKPNHPRPGPHLEPLEGRVYRVVLENGGNSHTDNNNPNCYKALRTPGALIVDNTDVLGFVDDGSILRADRRVYLGFASPSNHSVTHIATSLMVYHDTTACDLYPFFKSFQMSKLGEQSSGLPSTHACLDLDFSSTQTDYVETPALLKRVINLVISNAVRIFVDNYSKPFSLPTNGQLLKPPITLDSFLTGLSKFPNLKLFVTVRNLQRIFGRFLDAAMWDEYYARNGSTVDNRLDTIRELVLIPLWRNLANKGVVWKLLIAGPFLLVPLIQAPKTDELDPDSLPKFCDLSSHDTLHGYTPLQIRMLHGLSRAKVPDSLLERILDLCNRVVKPVISASSIFNPESVSAVCASVHGHLDKFQSVSQVAIQKRFCEKFMTLQRDRVLGILYPVLRRDESVAALANGLLNGKTLEQAHGPVYSLDSLISATTAIEKAARFFLAGLLTRVEREKETQPDYYKLAGGCARFLLEDAMKQAKKSYLQTPRTQSAEEAMGKFFSADEIADLILEHYRNVPYDQLPKDEHAFQADLAKVLRVALEEFLAKAGFPSDVQLEVWLKDGRRNRVGSRHLRFDIAVRIRSSRGPDKLIIFELKYFSLEDTKNATYANLDKINKGKDIQDQLVLDSRSSSNSSARFADELRSILPETLKDFSRNAAPKGSSEKVPVHWRTHPGPPPCDLRFAFSPEHIHCDYKEHQPKPHARAPTPEPILKVKTAVGVAGGADFQAQNYHNVSTLGIADQLGEGDGFADARFTDLGEGRTVILCYTVVNIAGALVYVNSHGMRSLNRKIGIVGVYPWSKDPTEAEVKAILDAKRKRHGD